MDKIKKYIKKINDIWQKLIDNKFFNKVFLFLPQNIFIFILFIISIIIMLNFKTTRFVPIYVQNVSDGIYENSLTEPFIIPLANIKIDDIKWEKSIDKVCFTFGTYAHKTNSIYNYKVVKNDNIIYENQFNTNILNDTEETCFPIMEADKTSIRDFTIILEPVRVDEYNKITIFKNVKTDEATMTLRSNETFLKNYEFIMLISIFIIFFLGLNYLINTKKIKIENMWLIFGILYIIPALFLNPPYEVPDEPIHFYNAYRLTQFEKDKNFYENLTNHYMELPENIDCITYVGIQKKDKLSDRNEVKECFKSSDKNIVEKIGYSFSPSKIAFLASAIGIKVADIFTNSPGIIFYMGRLFNALLSLFIIYKAIKIAPKHKELILLIATLPMFIQQMNSYSYDSLLNSFSLLAVSVILNMIYNKKLDLKKSSLLLLISGLYIANIKAIYLSLFILLLLLPDDKFKKTIHKYLYIFFIIFGSFILGNLSKVIFNEFNVPIIISSILTLALLILVLNLIINEKINYKIYLPIFLILLGVLAFYNYIYAGILLIMSLFIPTKSSKTKKIKTIIIIGIIILIGSFITIKLINNYNSKALNNVAGEVKINVKAIKIKGIIKSPTKLLTLAYNTIEKFGGDYLRGIVGYFGWFTYQMNDIFIIAYILMFAYIITHTSLIKTKRSTKVILWLTILITIGGVFLAMYLYWSGLALNYIEGVQGRYFLPIILPILLLFITSKKKKNIDLTEVTYTFINVVLLNYICLLINFFY